MTLPPNFSLFHGTNDANIESILNVSLLPSLLFLYACSQSRPQDGFWVGGVNGAPVVNGTYVA